MKTRAMKFSNDWKAETREHAEAKTFWDEFFHIFGISRRRVASFEKPVKKLNAQTGFIDLFWKGTLLVEHKSRGKNLDKAYSQALDYFSGLKEHELPKYVLVSDFERFRLYNLGAVLADFFQTLDTPRETRQSATEELLNQFPYVVNGRLFEEPLRIAAFTSAMREILLECCALDWGKISPAIFGSMFQAVMSPTARRNLGAHYTSEKNILKLIGPLFLDDLYAEFKKCKGSSKKLVEFHEKLSKLKFLDPACGCGNFLIITYRELRLLELEILRELHKGGPAVLDVSDILWIDVDQFYGIEYEEWLARIAEVALWLMDHQMNMLVSEEFGQYFVRLPLKKSAHITYGNALRLDWDHLISGSYIDLSADTQNVMKVEEPPVHYSAINVAAKKVNILTEEEVEELKTRRGEKSDFIFGNPPFVGSKYQSKTQREEMADIFAKVKGSGVLDYVTAWYIKATRYRPVDLLKAHQELDRAVDLCYRPQPFTTETTRVEFLFNLYVQTTETLLTQGKKKRKTHV